ncbi:1,3-beta-galactosyl-N-acetylhexosamine phosphorylase [Gleimia coleocanis DSM 15436]|uniref:1,3-beta-galactosyl-N-acetylhexosamine phosphorylase n=1 Tax=Gleimia coleocanis DSM 15436 TaxID=525245 RepID=C0VYG9_9ACTO|nr:1,3-beta-galactosyl-N-acetylhexosamine phosphorylase [Gleimia coleocanis]EEH64472.1 1,3-beta-galactosyl-N-acetylhexosamine phosphorylase [Gleimia coleocanis DSM 15436]
MATTGRVTLPIEVGIDEEVKVLMQRLGADAVRNSDGTELPALVDELAAKVYSTYFPARGDQEWAVANPETSTHLYLMSPRTPARGNVVEIDIMEGYLREQIQPDTEVDLARFWQVIDRTTGEIVDFADWEITEGGLVRVNNAVAGHVYTVNFLARQIWDGTQMYNYITNNWDEDPKRHKERPYNVRQDKVWDRVRSELDRWLSEHTEVDVVRFTTFFYHFTLVFNDKRKEKFVDWFGYTASVSPEAILAFEAEYGYAITPEDFVDEGFYNCSFRVPSKAFKDWVLFQHRFVTSRVRELTDKVHASGKEAMMFLGDNWIGTEPYGPHFKDTGIDAVVGSVGNAATCRMISDIPHVKYTEGRFLPYFFPDVFNENGDPVGEANVSWMAARRAIVRKPLDRIGYGGYLSLAIKFPEFVDRIEAICQEFRDIYEAAEGKTPQNSPVRVAVLNAWGSLRTWQTHMVAHALAYEQTQPYVGVLESLAGLPFDVQFLSFEDAMNGALENVDVVLNVGEAGTAFSGGRNWADPQLQAVIRDFVARGGGLIGVGEPAVLSANGAYSQLSDIFGVDREQSWSLSTDRYPNLEPNHFITSTEVGCGCGAGIGQISGPGAGKVRGALEADVTGGARYWVPVTPDVQVLQMNGVSVEVAAHDYADGRAVYFAGLPFNQQNARLLQKAIYWAAGSEDVYAASAHAADPRIDVAVYENGSVFVYNSSLETVTSEVYNVAGKTETVELEPLGSIWFNH